MYWALLVGGIPGRCREGRDFFFSKVRPWMNDKRLINASQERDTARVLSSAYLRGGHNKRASLYSSCVPPLAP